MYRLTCYSGRYVWFDYQMTEQPLTIPAAIVSGWGFIKYQTNISNSGELFLNELSLELNCSLFTSRID